MIPGTWAARMRWKVGMLMHRFPNQLKLGRIRFAAVVLLTNAAGLVTLGLWNAPRSLAQSSAGSLPAFEVASVKRSQADSGGMTMTSDLGRLTLRSVTLKFCIEVAYHARDYQLSGGPGWFGSESYDIDAKAAGPAKDSELYLMLQALLAERFKLSLHRETKEAPTYALVVGKNGIRVHEVEIGDGAELRVSRDRLTGRKVPMSRFAEALSNLLGRPVQDMTGLSGVFDFSLTWTPDESLPTQKPGVQGDVAPAAENASNPSIFGAVQEQLGLKLEARKGSVEILVIDHAERPTQN